MRYRGMLFFALILFVTCKSFAVDEKDIWGVWNIGEESKAIFSIPLSIDEFYRTSQFLAFDPNYHGMSRIIFEGGYYKIINISVSDSIYFLSLEWNGWVLNTEGKAMKKTINGLLAMHFIDINHMWLELVSGESTDPQFPTGDFKEEKVIFWRAAKKTK